MRGSDSQQGALFSYLSPAELIPAQHPLRGIRVWVDRVLTTLSPRFADLYPRHGRPSIPPEQLLRALLLQLLYSIRSERQLVEQIHYNLLFRWFVGLSFEQPVWDATSLTKNRDRFLEGDIARAFFKAVVAEIRAQNWASNDHFSVDGTLLEAWASHKSFRPKQAPPPPDPDSPSNPTVDFRGEKRSNATHVSHTDPDALLAKQSKGKEAKLSYAGHVLVENRHGLVVDAELTPAHGHAEHDALLWMAERLEGDHRVTLGGDKAYDDARLVEQLRRMKITPHVAQNDKAPGGSAIDARTTRQPGYELSQRKRKRVEEVFGWMKTVGLLRKLRHRGHRKVAWMFTFTAAVYNLVRMRTLEAAAPAA